MFQAERRNIRFRKKFGVRYFYHTAPIVMQNTPKGTPDPTSTNQEVTWAVSKKITSALQDEKLKENGKNITSLIASGDVRFLKSAAQLCIWKPDIIKYIDRENVNDPNTDTTKYLFACEMLQAQENEEAKKNFINSPLCRNITFIHLAWTELKSLSGNIWLFTNLTKLYLHHNQLTSLPPEIWKLENLTDLYLRGNQLTSLPPEIWNLRNLNVLDIAMNKLTSIPSKISNITKLKELNISVNPLNEWDVEYIKQALPDCRIRRR